jgi:hypothetical protein
MATSKSDCGQCAGLLRHLHAKNREIAQLKDEFAGLAQIRTQKAREVAERARLYTAALEANHASSPPGADLSSPQVTDARRIGALIARNAEIAAERDQLKAKCEALEKELGQRPPLRETSDATTQATLRGEVEELDSLSRTMPLMKDFGAASTHNLRRSLTPDSSQLRRHRRSLSTPYAADEAGESKPESLLPSTQHTPRRATVSTPRTPGAAVDHSLLSHSATTPRSADNSLLAREWIRGGRLHSAAAGTPTGLPARIVTSSSPLGRSASAQVEFLRSPRAYSVGEWMSPNLALLEEDPSLRPAQPPCSRPKLSVPRVSALVPCDHQRARDVALALEWRAARIPSGSPARCVGPNALLPRPSPGSVIGEDLNSPGNRSEGRGDVIGELRSVVARADRDFYLAMHDIEYHADPSAPFKMAFQGLKSVLAHYADAGGHNTNRASLSPIPDGKEWTVETAVVADIPAYHAAKLAKHLKRLVAGYDYLMSSKQWRNKSLSDCSTTVREFEANMPTLLTIAAQPRVRALLAR